MSAVDELQRAFRGLNKVYFDGKLEDVIITIQADNRKQAYAWISADKRWSNKANSWYREINIVAEYLNRAPAEIIGSLLHEMCHLYNIQNGIQDCSRGGSYHNTAFRDTALSHGLTCDHSKAYGWTVTHPNIETIAWVKDNVRPNCFRFQRAATWADGKPKKPADEDEEDNGKPAKTKRGKTNIQRYVCPKCGFIIRTSKTADNRLICALCTTNTDEPTFFERREK